MNEIVTLTPGITTKKQLTTAMPDKLKKYGKLVKNSYLDLGNKVIQSIGMIRQSDVDKLAILTVHLHLYNQFEMAAIAQPITEEGCASPALDEARKQLRIINPLLEEFGLTPTGYLDLAEKHLDVQLKVNAEAFKGRPKRTSNKKKPKRLNI